MRLAALAGALSAALLAQSISVSEHRLASGMKILVHEDHDIPNVAMYLFYRIGSRNERPAAPGIAVPQ